MVDHKIEKLIEEANKEVQNQVSQWRGGDIVGMVPGMGPSAIVPLAGNVHAGYNAGDEMGHPIAGAILGQEGAAGANANHNRDTSIGDVYTKENMIKRAVQAGVPMAAITAYFAANGNMDTAQMTAGLGALSAAGAAGVLPGVRYGAGKLFGGKPSELGK